MKKWIHPFRALLRSHGWDIRRCNGQTNIDVRRQGFLERLGIECVFDIGANVGAYGATLREFGYRGEIVSIEPTTGAFETLRRRAGRDSKWTARRLAVAGSSGERTMFVAANSVSSSLLERTPRLATVCPESRYVSEERVPAATLDQLLADAAAPLWVKLDVQGSAAEILSSTNGSLTRIAAIEIELAFVEMYRGEVLSLDTLAALQQEGFELVSLEPNTFDAALGTVLEVNAILVRGDAWNGLSK